MIEEPPLLKVKAIRPKPDLEKIEALRGVPTGVLTDALNGRGALDQTVKPLSPTVLPAELCGPALTCLCGPADILAILGSLHEITTGEILVIATDAWTKCAATGDRVIGMLKNAGGAGVVTDGLVRDVSGIESIGLPVYCAGVSPNSPFAKGPGEIGFTVQLAGVSVSSGDILVGDRDGIVVVPYNLIDSVIAEVAAIKILEADLDDKVSMGLKYPEYIAELMNSEQIKRL